MDHRRQRDRLPPARQVGCIRRDVYALDNHRISREDAQHVTTRNAAHAMATLRNTAISLLSTPPTSRHQTNHRRICVRVCFIDLTARLNNRRISFMLKGYRDSTGLLGAHLFAAARKNTRDTAKEPGQQSNRITVSTIQTIVHGNRFPRWGYWFCCPMSVQQADDLLLPGCGGVELPAHLGKAVVHLALQGAEPFPDLLARGVDRRAIRVDLDSQWWAQQGSNLRPPPCKGGALPLSYAPVTGAGAEQPRRRSCVVTSGRRRPSSTRPGPAPHPAG